MKIITIANNKGGVAKTTLSKIISEYFAKSGKRTLGIDLDPQANFSRRFVDMEANEGYGFRPPLHNEYDPSNPEDEGWDGRSSSADIYFYGNAATYPTHIDNLELVPAHGKMLGDVETVTKQEVASKVHNQLKLWLGSEEIKNEYDVVVIDTSPSKGPLTASAIRAATHVLIPAEMDQFSSEGLFGMLAMWQRENLTRNEGEELKLIGILPTKFNARRAIDLHFLEQLQEQETVSPYIMPMKMHYWSDYTESNMFGAKSILDLRPSSKSRKEAESICDFIKEKMFNE